MSGYSRMQAPPFWRWMFRIAGILCLVTLLTPAVYCLKYAALDSPRQVEIARRLPENNTQIAAPKSFDRTEYYIKAAKQGQTPDLREQSLSALGQLVAKPFAQVTRPIECLHAKIALGQDSQTDPDPRVREVASQVLMDVASRGAVIKR